MSTPMPPVDPGIGGIQFDTVVVPEKQQVHRRMARADAHLQLLAAAGLALALVCAAYGATVIGRLEAQAAPPPEPEPLVEAAPPSPAPTPTPTATAPALATIPFTPMQISIAAVGIEAAVQPVGTSPDDEPLQHGGGHIVVRARKHPSIVPDALGAGQGARRSTVRGRTISHSERHPITAQQTITDAMVVAVMPASRAIHPTRRPM